MLLMTKRRHANAIREGRKTIEIRCGLRYRNVGAGSNLSINGHFRVSVAHAERYETLSDLLAAVDLQRAALTPEEAPELLREYYSAPGPWFAFHLRPPSA